MENFYDNSIKRIVIDIEKNIEVHVAIEKGWDMDEKEKVEANGGYDSFYKKKEEIAKTFETNKNFLKEI